MLVPLKRLPVTADVRKAFATSIKQHSATYVLLLATSFGLSVMSACTPNNSTNLPDTSLPSTQPAADTSSTQAVQNNVVRIGYQKYGTLNIVKARNNLEQRLKSEGISVQWIQFPAGPQLLEALNASSIDFGHTGEAPPIFAQAAGAPLVYVAHEPPNPKGEAILVSQNSQIQDVAQLKGKKVALNKGANVHYLLVQALAAAGLKYSDIQPVYLPPAEARAAFERGSVDAWAIWDPFFTAAKRATGARVRQPALVQVPSPSPLSGEKATIQSSQLRCPLPSIKIKRHTSFQT